MGCVNTTTGFIGGLCSAGRQLLNSKLNNSHFPPQLRWGTWPERWRRHQHLAGSGVHLRQTCSLLSAVCGKAVWAEATHLSSGTVIVWTGVIGVKSPTTVSHFDREAHVEKVARKLLTIRQVTWVKVLLLGRIAVVARYSLLHHISLVATTWTGSVSLQKWSSTFTSYWRDFTSMRQSLCNGTVSVRLVCLSAISVDRCMPLRRVCCCGPGGQEISVDSGSCNVPQHVCAAARRTAARRAATQASSVTLSADVGSWRHTCIMNGAVRAYILNLNVHHNKPNLWTFAWCNTLQWSLIYNFIKLMLLHAHVFTIFFDIAAWK